jgi:hypothetical protein
MLHTQSDLQNIENGENYVLLCQVRSHRGGDFLRSDEIQDARFQRTESDSKMHGGRVLSREARRSVKRTGCVFFYDDAEVKESESNSLYPSGV